MSTQGNGRGGGKKKSKGKSKITISTPPPPPSQDQQTPIEDLVTSPTVVVNMEPPTPSTDTTFQLHHPQAQRRPTNSAVQLGSPILSYALSPKPIYYEDFRRPSLTPHQHEHPEPSIGERFGRRHGQDWPTPPREDRCASCPGSRPESRSQSRGGMRRTSGVLYKVIPVRPVMGHEVFQAARKSEKAIAANKILDSFAEVEEVLREHREEEDAMTKTGSQLPNVRSGDLFNMAPEATGGNGDTYGSTSGSGTSNNGVLSALSSQKCLAKDAVVIAVPTKNVGEDDEDEAAGNGRGENAPLIDGYARKKRTSPELVQLAINASFLANVFLVIIKIWTVLLSDSLAVLASMIDSLMDLLSGAIIWYSARLRNNTSDGHRYPVGKARMEPLGIIVFAAVMVTSFMQVMLQAFERLVEGSEEPPVNLGFVILLLLGLNIVIKFLLWLWCRTMKDSSSVLALAQDHLNDVIFNVFSTFFPVAGQYLGWWWLDAVGAIVLSICIISEWTSTCLHNIRRLTGQAASPAEFQQLTYMAYRFSNMIQAIDTVRAYYAGDGLFVEIDIVLPPDTPLSQTHDLGESLQGALERLDNVERAFVHIDYNTVHAIEHR
ncbi:hypothetical protein BGZ96_009842 [Linnemannia gamsii]|uniref:Cation efflux protein cytoplasmic domain-containing protein n=1 Tax=Linnemannia gamsii TaxID=64522 RepID=A0ABQ7JVG3_9FUNG|nr:hypothetical protein BGZ96_009842 [Linnemannia gamsii]